MLLNIENGSSEYTGNVIIQRGAITLQGDKVVIKRYDNTVQHIIIEGKPARYKQEGEQNYAEAESETMQFDVDSNLLTMTSNVRLKQSDQLIESQHIQLDTEKQILLGGGNTAADDKQRINIILSPKQKH